MVPVSNKRVSYNFKSVLLAVEYTQRYPSHFSCEYAYETLPWDLAMLVAKYVSKDDICKYYYKPWAASIFCTGSNSTELCWRSLCLDSSFDNAQTECNQSFIRAGQLVFEAPRAISFWVTRAIRYLRC